MNHRAARRLRIPRSQLYVRAVAEYLKRQAKPEITARLNAVYGGAKRSRADRAFLEQAVETLRRTDWQD